MIKILDIIRDILLGLAVVMALFLIGAIVIGLWIHAQWVLVTIWVLAMLYMLGWITRALITAAQRHDPPTMGSYF